MCVCVWIVCHYSHYISLGCAAHAVVRSSQQDMAFRSSAELMQRMTRDWDILRTLHGCSSEELSERFHVTDFSIGLYILVLLCIDVS